MGLDNLKYLIPTDYRSLLRNVLHNCESKMNKMKGLEYPNYLLFDETPKHFYDTFSYNSLNVGNNYYGIERVLKDYAGYEGRIKGAIEHGLYLGDYVNKFETCQSNLPGMFTFGGKRKRVINEHYPNIKVLEIGPYIHYAQTIISEGEINNLKRELGKTLLVFPAHSIEDINVEFEFENFMTLVEKLQKKLGAETVIFCLYFHDVNNGVIDLYEDRNCKVVCAGHRSDPNFLARLKTFLSLSDYTASNSIGTHVGYSEYMNREHFFLSQTVTRSEGISKVKTCDWKSSSSEADKLQIKRALEKPFGSEERLEILDFYWGFSKIRNAATLKETFLALDASYKKREQLQSSPLDYQDSGTIALN